MIKSFKKFNESISGTELIGPMGPNYGDTTLPHKPNSKYTDVVYSEIFGRVVTQDEYQGLYQEYLKRGGKPLHDFNSENLELVLSKINESTNINSIVVDLFQDLSDDCIDISYKRDPYHDTIEFSWYGNLKLNISKESYSLLSNMIDLSRICKDISYEKNDNIQSLMETDKYSLLKKYLDRMENELNVKIKNIDHYQDPTAQYWGQKTGFIVLFISRINTENLELSKINENTENTSEDIQDYFIELVDNGNRVEFISDFDGYGTDCIEIEIMTDIIDDNWANFIYDLYQIRKELQNKLDLIYLPPKRIEFKNKELSDKIDITKYSEFTINQFKRLQSANGLIICDVTHELSGSPGMPENNHLYRIKFRRKGKKRKRINESIRNIHDEISDLFQDVIDDGISVEYNNQSSTYDSIKLSWVGDWKKFTLSKETRDLMRGLIESSNEIEQYGDVKRHLYGIAKKHLDRLESLFDIVFLSIHYDNGYNDEDDEVKIWGPDPGYLTITFSKINI